MKLQFAVILETLLEFVAGEQRDTNTATPARRAAS